MQNVLILFQQLMQIIEQEAAAKGRHSRISVNVPQSVFYITFQENVSAQTVVQEHVDVDGEIVCEDALDV